jgi:hypothetical protein
VQTGQVDETGRDADDGPTEKWRAMGKIGKPEREIHIPVPDPVAVPAILPDSSPPEREPAPAEPVSARR